MSPDWIFLISMKSSIPCHRLPCVKRLTLNIQLSNPKGFNFRNFSFTFFISLDINLGGLTDEDGLILTQHLLERFPDQKIVILSGYNLPVYRKEAKRIGARGFISKDVEPDELLHILLTIKNGATHFPREEVFIEELTDGERKVLELVASGVRRREIAEQLFISERTVSNHLQHIFEKLQVSSTVEMITKAIKLGYIAQSSIQRSCERKASCASGSDRS